MPSSLKQSVLHTLPSMRISFILSSLWLSGGVRVIVEYANRLAARGHEIALVVPKGTLDPDMLAELDPKVKTIEARLPRGESMALPKMAVLTWSLARAVPPSDVIVSTHTPTTLAGWLAHRLNGSSKLVWLYQDYREMFIGRPLEDWLVRNALRWHSRALVVSDYSRQELQSYASGDVVIVGEGLSHAESFHPIHPDERLRDAKGRTTILFLGDMRPRKGLSDFLAAAEMVYRDSPNIVLWIVSKEDCQIETKVPFEYIYRPSRADLARLYGSCDVFVSSSWWESFGLPPLEAMACGAPVVMTDSRGARDYARNDENCLMVQPRDVNGLAVAMQRLLMDARLADRLARSGRQTAVRYNWSAAMDRMEAALLDLTRRDR